MLLKVMHKLHRTRLASAAHFCTDPPRLEKTINQVTLLGRVGINPQKRGTFDHPVVVFSMATHHNYKQASGDLLQKTDWHRISVFRPYLRDKIEKYLVKGQRVLVQGRITYGEYKDDNEETKMATTIIADDVIFLTHRSTSES